MSPHQCYTLDELVDAREAAENDPRRRHLELCPRCRAALAEYLEFADPAPLPQEADVEDAGWRLDAFRKARLEQDNIIRPWFRRPLTMLAGLAAVVVLAAGLPRFLSDHGAPPAEIILRDLGDQEFALLAEATSEPSGEVHWTWQAVTGADAYEVRLFDSSLALLLTVPAGNALELTLTAPAAAVAWQVAALRAGDELARSRPAPWPRP